MTAFDLFDITEPGEDLSVGPLGSPRVSVRFPVRTPPIDTLIPTLQRVVAERSIEGELLVDAASYAHVPEGPGVLLVGASAHYGITAGEAPVLYRAQKRPWPIAPLDRIRESIRRTRQLAEILSAAHEDFAIDGEHVDIAILDRLRAPNTLRTLGLVAPALTAIFGGAEVTPVGGPGDPFAVRVRRV